MTERAPSIRLPSIRHSAPALFLLPVVIVIVALSVVVSWQGGRLADRLAARVLDQAVGRIETSVDASLRNAVLVTGHVAAAIDGGDLDPARLATWRGTLHRELLSNTAINSVTYGSDDGRATWMIRYPDEPGLEYALKEDGASEAITEYRVDERGSPGPEIGSYPYDPRKRPWYRAAVEAGAPTWSEAYAWVRGGGRTPALGIAYARPVTAEDGRTIGVLESDISLRDVSHFLAEARVFDSGESILVEPGGLLIGTSADHPVVGPDGERLAATEADDPRVRDAARGIGDFAAIDSARDERIVSGGQAYRVHVRPLDNPWGLDWRLAVIVPEAEVLAGVSELRRQTWLIGGVVVAGTLLLGVFAAGSLVSPVTRTVDAVRRIGAGDLDEPVRVGGHREFVQLSDELNRMAASLKDHLRLRQSLGLAMEIQQKLLPDGPPRVPGLDVAGHCTYCDETGGDYYDFLELGESDSHELIVALGDVMGHGIAAALLMATARGILRSRADEEGSLGELLTHVNRQLVADTGGERFMTMVLLVIDPRRRTVRLATAGHDAPILFDPSSGAFSELTDPGGMPLGLDEDEAYAEVKYPVAPGQILLVATDGLWESMDTTEEPYGKERLYEVIRAHAGASADELSEAIRDDLRRFRGEARQDDDITFVLVRLT